MSTKLKPQVTLEELDRLERRALSTNGVIVIYSVQLRRVIAAARAALQATGEFDALVADSEHSPVVDGE